MKKDTHKVIYIAGCNHSGSTILEMLLGNLRKTWATGETHFALQELEGKRKNRPRRFCGCGQSVNQCPFWQKVKKEISLHEKKSNQNFQAAHPVSFQHRLSDFYHMLFGTLPNISEAEAWSNKIFFKSIKKTVQERQDEQLKFFVDSSKGPRRLLHLINCPDVEVKLIHLMKDPRAFIYSKMKNKKGYSRKLWETFEEAYYYTLLNLIIEKLSEYLPEQSKIQIRYEDYASEPEKILKQIADRFQIPFERTAVTNFSERENHGFLGNQARLKSDDIYLDERWKTKMNGTFKKLAKGMTYPLGYRYGYF